MAALAVSHLLRPGTKGMMAMAGVAVGGSHLLATGVDTAVGAAFILLLFGQMAVAAQFGDIGWSGYLIGRNVADRSAMLFARTVADTAIKAG
jgi:1,4-dihydroxy-2-naphthoyl-CoA synthase